MSAGSHPDLSVVVVAYRARERVLRCLGSVEANAGLSHDVLVVDDGSGDGTPEAVGERFPAATVIAKPVNEGLAAGRNAALPHVRGRLVLMLDADTRLLPGAVGAMANLLDRRPEVGLVGPKLVYPDGRVQLSCHRWPSPLIPLLRRGPYAALSRDPRAHQRHMMKDFDHQRERPVVSVMGAAQMWRSTLPDLIGEFDERISSYGGEDVDWCLRVWAAGLEVRYAPQATVEHEWQHLVRRRPWSRHSLRALRDFYYLQWKHRRVRRLPPVAAANR
jgi:N-acetylglucosaminyl-diphospho-decaprenol L-rhamnosyltransferase